MTGGKMQNMFGMMVMVGALFVTGAASAQDYNAIYCKMVNAGGTVDDLEQATGIRARLMDVDGGTETWWFPFASKSYGARGALVDVDAESGQGQWISAVGFDPIPYWECEDKY